MKTFLLILYLIGTSLCLAQTNDSSSQPEISVSWKFLIKPIEVFYLLPQAPTLNEEALAQFIDQKLEKFGSRLPDFENKVNSVDTKLTIKELIKLTALNGFPAFGNHESSINQDVRNMLFFIFERLETLAKPEDADRTFKTIVEGYTHCQQVQYRTIQDIFLNLMDKGSLKTRVAILLNDLKKKWLMQTIFKMEDSSSTELNPHLENAYLKAIGEAFGISGFEEAKADQLAIARIDKIEARQIFRSLVKVDEIVSFVHDDFTSSMHPQEQAEIFRWAVEKNYDLEQVYDVDGLVTKAGVEQILVDLEVLDSGLPGENQSIVERQEQLFESFLPTTGYTSWAEFEQSCKAAPLLAPLWNAFDQEEIKLSVYAPQRVRTEILKQGLLNQYQARSSRGYLGVTGRFTSERSHLNMVQEEYELIPLDIKPKYGMILAKNSFTHPLPRHAYGEDVFVLKLDNLRSRLTWAPGGSSLNRHSKKAKGVNADWENGAPYEPSRWDDIYLPWSKRHLLIPFLQKGAFNKKGSLKYRPHDRSGNIKSREILGKTPAITAAYDAGEADVIEFQAWGPLSPNDIESFIFTKSRPDPVTLNLLAEYQIGTFDGTHGAPVPYRTTYFDWDENWKCHLLTFDFNSIATSDADSKKCAKIAKLTGCDPTERLCIGDTVYGLGHSYYSKVVGIFQNGSANLLHSNTNFTYRYPMNNIAISKGCDPTQKICVGDRVYSPKYKSYSTVVGIFPDGDAYIRNSNTTGTFRSPVAVLKKSQEN